MLKDTGEAMRFEVSDNGNVVWIDTRDVGLSLSFKSIEKIYRDMRTEQDKGCQRCGFCNDIIPKDYDCRAIDHDGNRWHNHCWDAMISYAKKRGWIE